MRFAYCALRAGQSALRILDQAILLIIINSVGRCRAAHCINESQPGRAFLVPLELWPPENPASRELLYTSIVTTKTVQPTRCRP